MGLNLDVLNEAQKAAVLQKEGPMMIIAGAGSGKTRVLTFRIAHLMDQGVDSFNILALTFTNKAAREMRNRIETEVGNEARNLWMGTFHSVFARILRAEGAKLGYPSNFTIYDTDDSKSLIKSIVKEFNLDDKLYKANVVLNRISAAKSRLISSQQYIDDPIYLSEDTEMQRPEIGRIYKAYAERCFKSSAMDFDDLLFNTHVLFHNHIDVLNKYQDRFKYVLVDEFQDTNYSQYLITRKLASRYQNICVVGDDAQSIYAFRGADITNILNFEKDYDDLKVFKLEQNYRSTKIIVEAANAVIKNNTAQLPKKVWTSNDDGDYIELIRATSDNEEARIIASQIFQNKMNEQLNNSDFAILYRTNAQSRSMEEALRKINIPYRIYGGLSFYQRKEIKDVIAYIRFVVNHNDEEAFKRIINWPKRGIGNTSIAKLIVAANENNTSIWEACKMANKIFPQRTATALSNFVTLIESMSIDMDKRDAHEAAEIIVKRSGLMKEYYEDKTMEGIARYENIQELLNGIKEFVDNPETEDKSLGSYLQQIALLTDQDNDDGSSDRVTLMTIHSAKGLEFKHVHIVGLEEDLFPSAMMLSSRADLEEERRLFYVAITRAEKKLTLSYALSRYRYGTLHSCEPSRFLDEVDPRFLKVTERSIPKGPPDFNIPPKFRKTNKPGELPKTAARNLRPLAKKVVSNYKVPNDFEPSNTENLAEGMKVEHPKFGFGKVKKVESYQNQRKAMIYFDNFGEKTLLLSFAKLKIHS
ncbi:UvrD-helicase domain-containing protein [Hyphobacterium sp. CCMP332]|nr:UvrD-helicase domain-containing protein [Hyphobacterium sp. CCMP332]